MRSLSSLLVAAATCVFAVSAFGARHTLPLNANWYFTRGDWDETPPSGDLAKNGWDSVNLPHTWNALETQDEAPGYYMGPGRYYKTFTLPEGFDGCCFLRIEAANDHARILINGQIAAEHLGGHLAFNVDLTPYLVRDGQNELLIEVTNAANDSIPPLEGDFNLYGGLTRDVSLILTPKTHFDFGEHGSMGVFIDTPSVSAERAVASVRALIVDDGTSSEGLKLVTRLVSPSGELVAHAEEAVQPVANARAEVAMELPAVDQPALWSPTHPNLYRIDVELRGPDGSVLDSYSHAVGFRWFSANEDGFMLNGEPLELMGACKHEDYVGLGDAIDHDAAWRDLRLIKSMGGNFVRLSHYPQDDAVLEACDRLGIIVYSEIQLVNEVTPSKEFHDVVMQLAHELVAQQRNHPSIFFWGSMNEVLISTYRKNLPPKERTEYFAAVRSLIEEVNDYYKEADPSRLTSFAMHGDYDMYKEAGLLDIPDVPGMNLYYGWYIEGFQGAADFIEKYHREVPGKALLLTEYGAGADPRIHSAEPVRFDFSTEWEVLFHQHHINLIRETPYLVGGLVWHLFDFQSDWRSDAVSHINSKGLTSLERVPKDAYRLYQAELLDKPFAEFSRDFLMRAGIADTDGATTCTQSFSAFSNLDKATLSLDGKALGEAVFKNGEAQWQVPFHDGRNLLMLEGEATDGTSVRDAVVVDFTLHPRDYHHAADFPDLNVNLGAPFFFVDPVDHVVWMPEKPYEAGNWGYEGGERWMPRDLGIGSGDRILRTTTNPIYQTQRMGKQVFRCDAPAGLYEISLHLAELQTKEQRAQMVNNLGAGENKSHASGERVFDIRIDGNLVAQDVNPGTMGGELGAIILRYEVPVSDDGIRIALEPKKGEPCLGAVQIRKLQ